MARSPQPNDRVGVVAHHRARFEHGHVQIAPAITAKKLTGALHSYGQDVASEDVLALVDTTLLGSAKDGALLTHDGLVAHDVGDPVTTIPYDQIHEVELRGSTLVVNERPLLNIAMVEEKQAFIEFVRALVDPDAEPDPATDAAPGTAEDRFAEGRVAACGICAKMAPIARSGKVHTAIQRSSTRHSGFKEYETLTETVLLRTHPYGICADCKRVAAGRGWILFGAWSAFVVVLAFLWLALDAITGWLVLGLALAALVPVALVAARFVDTEERMKRRAVAIRAKNVNDEVAWMEPLHKGWVDGQRQPIPTEATVIGLNEIELKRLQSSSGPDDTTERRRSTR